MKANFLLLFLHNQMLDDVQSSTKCRMNSITVTINNNNYYYYYHSSSFSNPTVCRSAGQSYDTGSVKTWQTWQMSTYTSSVAVVSARWGTECVRLRVVVKSDNCGDGQDCSSKGVCFSNISMVSVLPLLPYS